MRTAIPCAAHPPADTRFHSLLPALSRCDLPAALRPAGVRRARQRRLEGTFTDVPFLPQARVVALPVAPHFVATGDFDADGHADVVVAERDRAELWWLTGTGAGRLGTPRPLSLNGAVTALVAGKIRHGDGAEQIPSEGEMGDFTMAEDIIHGNITINVGEQQNQSENPEQPPSTPPPSEQPPTQQQPPPQQPPPAQQPNVNAWWKRLLTAGAISGGTALAIWLGSQLAGDGSKPPPPSEDTDTDTSWFGDYG